MLERISEFFGHPRADVDLPILRPLSEQTRRALSKAGREVAIPQHWTPVHDGTPADKVYLVRTGRMSVRQGGMVLGEIGPNSFAGEMGPIGSTLRTATLVVEDPVVAIVWPREEFDRIRREHPDFDRLVSGIARGRRESNARLAGAGGRR